ncbi:Exodeoxyribonuclease 7 small subunit [Sporotomaculum syntrophicum]|uniref:Exodeoxyribonuclease 7 small subunit n=1 Tax=Sporotomaculum syntrophicum TaxID=182264 RepID=A0A9D2WTV3_9FIRM|nr:exodeoxyribonuclease VII small subunit [Sporotomaculum syntrophicum]KAF1086527.1 Exodeoxyribonuclease 7 small subunit [Sporotomaculum syntrophicum]
MNNNDTLTFEEALSRLEVLVNRLEEGNLPLEESLDLFAEGIKLTKHCSKHLEQAEKQIYVLLEDDNGRVVIREEEL